MHYIMHISCQLLFLGEKTIWRVENMELVLVENQGYIFIIVSIIWYIFILDINI